MGPRPFSRGNEPGPRAASRGADAASMGPRPFSRGNTGCTRCPGRMPAVLQWGHGLSAVETVQRVGCLTELFRSRLQWGHGLSAVETEDREPTARTAGIIGLQWGHGLSAVETSPRVRVVGRLGRLQWGHGLSRGNRCSNERQPSHIGAFTGPRPFSRGNPATAGALANGLSLQWGHGLSAVETSSLRRTSGIAGRFNGATAFQPWKRQAWATVAHKHAGSFNGATAFQPWKPAVSIEKHPAACDASMGPRPFSRGERRSRMTWDPPMFGALQWGHGLSAVETPTVAADGGRCSGCFNGATAFQPWKFLMIRQNLGRIGVASMGPRPFSRGNREARPREHLRLGLQWGHGLTAVETADGVPTLFAWEVRFDGATASQPWKRARFRSRESLW